MHNRTTQPLEITHSKELHDIFYKLSHCQDPSTGRRVFIGTVRLEFGENDELLLTVEEQVWETESGEPIPTQLLRA